MNILFTRFPLESAYGGAEVQTISLMKGFLARGHSVAFLGSCKTLLQLCNENGIPSSKLNIGDPPVTKWGAISFLWRKQKMRKTLEGALSTFNIQHSTFNTICMLSLSEKLLLTPYARAHGIRVIWIEHDRIGRWLKCNPWLSMLRSLSRDVTTVTVSDFTKDAYLALGWKLETVVSIPNGVAAPAIGSSGKRKVERSKEGKVFCIGCVSRLTHDKGVDLLIDAARNLPEVHIKILGRGMEKGNLWTRIENLQLGDRVTIEKHVKDIDDFYNSIDILVLPTRSHDTFGLVVAEAMMRGIPTICTVECGIVRHIKPGRNAIVCEANSSEALEKAIVELLDSTRRAEIGKQGKEAAQKYFTVERMVDEYEKMIER